MLNYVYERSTYILIYNIYKILIYYYLININLIKAIFKNLKL